ncbi:MAG: hypothetical protein NVSMB38_19990 [Ktedonobacteraceae bacterium]
MVTAVCTTELVGVVIIFGVDGGVGISVGVGIGVFVGVGEGSDDD